jgi:hypothetical protein
MLYYGFIYITENLLNGKKYIGQRAYTKGWQGYLGSGRALKRAIKKYGRMNFSRKIISEWETFILENDAVKNPQFYNLIEGGSTSPRGFANHKHTEEHKEKARKNAMRPVTIDGITYSSRAEAKQQLGCNNSRLTKLANGQTKFGRRKGGEHPTAIPVTILGVKYETVTEACQKTKMGQTKIKRFLRDGDETRLVVEKRYPKQPVTIDKIDYRSFNHAAKSLDLSVAKIKEITGFN